MHRMVAYILNGRPNSPLRVSSPPQSIMRLERIVVGRERFKNLCETFPLQSHLFFTNRNTGLIHAHTSGWRRLLLEPNNIEYALIFEDDEIVPSSFWPSLECFLNNTHIEFDFLNLNAFRYGDPNGLTHETCSVRHKRHHSKGCFEKPMRDVWMGAYVIRRRLVAPLLRHAGTRNLTTLVFDVVVSGSLCEMGSPWSVYSVDANQISNHGKEGRWSYRTSRTSRMPTPLCRW